MYICTHSNFLYTILQFKRPPHGPLRVYITEDVDKILDVKHMMQYYVVSCFDDKCLLWDTAKNFGLAPPTIITYDYDASLIEEACQVPGYADMPVVVMNVLMDYGKNYIVSGNFFQLQTLYSIYWV